jgi:Tfp pilus assembly protein PilE
MRATRFVLAIFVAAASASAWAAPPKASAQESLIDLVPAKARAAVIVRKNAIAPLRDFFTGDVEMMRELQPFLERAVGIDLTRIEGVIAFTTDTAKIDNHLGILLRIPSSGGALKLPAAGDASGTPLYKLDRDVVCARTRAGLVFGSEVEVRAGVAVDKGREPALTRDAGLGRLLVTDVADADFVAAVGPGALPPDKTMGVEDGLLLYRHGGNLELALHGEPTQLKALAAIMAGGVQMGISQLAQEKDKAVATNDPWKGSTAIVAYHQAKRLAAELEPKIDGNTLRIRYRFPDTSSMGSSSLTLAMVGVLSAVAIPAFRKYVARSKSEEARANLQALTTAVIASAETAKKASQLKSTEWTPKAACCGQANNKCAPDAKQWQAPTWRAINFSVTEPGYYQYRVRVEGKGAATTVTVEARGDLDCDGEYSSFRRVISYGADGPSAAPMQSENESE